MKFATFYWEGRLTVGVVDQDHVWPIETVLGQPVANMLQLIERYGETKPEVRLAKDAVPLTSVKLAAPIPRPPRNIFCVGKNYYEHAHEFASSGFDSSATGNQDAVPGAPYIFTKLPETVIGEGQTIEYPSGVSDSLDYEAELGLIIGKKGRKISREDAYSYVWGYTVINDVTARDWQSRHKQWFLGKSFDTFCPMGPWIVTADNVDPEDLRIRCWVNDELRQDANTHDLIFDVPSLIETISAGITLYPGDIIATGTPKGVGIGFDPPKFLQPGDNVKITIDGIGTLQNRVGKP